MKHSFFTLLLTLFLALGLTGCNTQNNPETANERNTTEQEQAANEESHQATIRITKENQQEEVSEKNVTFQEGESLLDVMNREFEIVDEGGGFITKIDDVSVNKEENIWFFLYVNGEMAEVGAKDVILKEGDEITWDLHKYEG